MARPTYPLLPQRQLNRATLARQLLLAPTELDPVTAVERVGGLQAQEPASPYVALWSRLRDFEAATLDAAFRERRMIKATLVRITVHAVSRDDYVRLLPAVLPMLRRARRLAVVDTFDDLDALADQALAFATVPRSNSEIRDFVRSVTGRADEDGWWRVRRHAPFVHVPSGVAWSFGRRPVLIGAPSWVEPRFAEEAEGLRHVAVRYLGAFGPATIADMASWSGLPVASLRPAIKSLDEAERLVRYSDERGRELLDVQGASLPEADAPAPPRLLPMWDSVLLAHADRSRILPAEHRPRVIQRNGDVLPTFLVDGMVAGLWWAETDGLRTRVRLEPFEPHSKSVRVALEEAGDRLARFVEPLEPNVFARYRWDRTRTARTAAQANT